MNTEILNFFIENGILNIILITIIQKIKNINKLKNIDPKVILLFLAIIGGFLYAIGKLYIPDTLKQNAIALFSVAIPTTIGIYEIIKKYIK